jgi:hypothetical protein
MGAQSGVGHSAGHETERPFPSRGGSREAAAAKPNGDGSFTIRFGGRGEGFENCLPIMEGWKYAVRMYEPEQSIQDGTWTFPGPPTPRTK